MVLSSRLKELAYIFRDTYSQWIKREPFRSSAVIAFYTIFSMPGLLVIIINLAGYFYGEEAITRRISTEIEGMIGGSTAKDIEAIIANASVHRDLTLTSVIGIASLIFGATGVFYQIQQTLNQIWEVEPQPEKQIIKMIIDRIFSFGLILAVGFLLLVSLVLSALLTLLSDWVSFYFSETFSIFFRFLDLSLSLGVITFLFAAIFKLLPDAKVPWKDVWVGALVTALLFVIAKFALGFYFAHSNPASAYGAAGTVILIMLWVSYAGLILLFGAEFTRIYADRHGDQPDPSDFAISTKESEASTSANKNSSSFNNNISGSNMNAQKNLDQQTHQTPVTDNIYPLDKDMVMGHKATTAGGPDDISVGGEEDPGVGLESLVTNNEPKNNP